MFLLFAHQPNPLLRFSRPRSSTLTHSFRNRTVVCRLHGRVSRNSSFPPGQLRLAQQLRKAGDCTGARKILVDLAPDLGDNIDFLNENILVTAAELLQTGLNDPQRLVSKLYDLCRHASMNTVTFNSILSSLRSISNENIASIAESVVDDLLSSNLRPDHFTLSIAFQICGKECSLPHTIRMHEKFTDFGLNAISGASLVAAYVRCKSVDRAERVMEQLLSSPNVRLNARPFSTLISAFGRVTNHKKALFYFNAADDHPYVEIDDYIILSIIKSCGAAGDATNALRIFRDMEQRGIAPTIDILFAMLRVAVTAYDSRISHLLLFEYAPNYPSFRLTSAHIGRLLSTYKRDPRLDNAAGAKGVTIAFRHVVQTKLVEPDVVLCNSFVSVLAGVGNVTEALKFVIYQYPKFKILPNVFTYNALIHGYNVNGDVDSAMTILQVMKNQRVAPSQVTYNSLLDALPSTGYEKLRQQILRELSSNPNLQMDDVAITSQLKHFRKLHNTEGVVVIHREAVRSGRTFDGRAYSLLLSTLLENGQQATAISIFAWLAYKGLLNVEILNVMLEFKCRQEMSEAFIMFKRMKQKPVAPNATTYTIMIRGAAGNGMLNTGFRLLSEMQDVGCALQDSFAWTALIDGCAQDGQWKRGVELFDSMCRSDSAGFAPAPTTATYNAALYAAGVHGGDLDVAFRIFKVLQDDANQQPDAITFSALASSVLSNHEKASTSVVKATIANLQNAVLDTNLENGAVVDLKKLTAKIKRLQWVLAQKIEGTPGKG